MYLINFFSFAFGKEIGKQLLFFLTELHPRINIFKMKLK